MFFVGQKVVCVVDWRREALLFSIPYWPVKDEIYTIAIVRTETNAQDCGQDCGLVLVELANPRMLHADGEMKDPAWSSFGFRPLIERKTDISCFQRILARPPARTKIPERV